MKNKTCFTGFERRSCLEWRLLLLRSARHLRLSFPRPGLRIRGELDSSDNAALARIRYQEEVWSPDAPAGYIGYIVDCLNVIGIIGSGASFCGF